MSFCVWILRKMFVIVWASVRWIGDVCVSDFDRIGISAGEPLPFQMNGWFIHINCFSHTQKKCWHIASSPQRRLVYQNINLLVFLGMDELIIYKNILYPNNHLNSQPGFLILDQIKVGPNKDSITSLGVNQMQEGCSSSIQDPLNSFTWVNSHEIWNSTRHINRTDLLILTPQSFLQTCYWSVHWSMSKGSLGDITMKAL